MFDTNSNESKTWRERKRWISRIAMKERNGKRETTDEYAGKRTEPAMIMTATDIATKSMRQTRSTRQSLNIHPAEYPGRTTEGHSRGSSPRMVGVGGR